FVHTQESAAFEQHGVDLLGGLYCREAVRVGLTSSSTATAAAATSASAPAAAARIAAIVLGSDLVIGTALGWRSDVHRHHCLLADEHHFAFDLGFIGGDPGGHFVLGGAQALRAAAAAAAEGTRRRCGVRIGCNLRTLWRNELHSGRADGAI